MLSFSVRFAGLISGFAGSLLALVLVSGCSTGGAGATGSSGSGSSAVPRTNQLNNVPSFADLLRKGDLIQIIFSGIPVPPAAMEERIKEDGTLNLPLVGTVDAEGKTPGVLQKEIEERYVPKFYRRLTVTVKTERRVFFVDGEVRRPDRFVYEGAISLLQAIASAQGFTDFAARGRVELIRSTGERLVIDTRKAKDKPELDVQIVPGDRIIVPRRSPFGR